MVKPAMRVDLGGARPFTLRMDVWDILAIGAVIVAIIIANGVANKTVDANVGATIIIALVGSAGIAQVIKAKRRKK